MQRNLVLIGPQSIGKSIIGKLLSEDIGYDFQDTDDLIKSEYKLDINEMLKYFSWSELRAIESELLEKYVKTAGENNVLSTSYGILGNPFDNIRASNINLLKYFGVRILIVPTNNLEVSVSVMEKIVREDNSAVSYPDEDAMYEKIPELTDKFGTKERELILRNYWSIYSNSADITITRLGSDRCEMPQKIIKEVNNFKFKDSL